MKADPVLVLEFAGKGDKKAEKEAAKMHEEAMEVAAKKIRGAKSDKEFAKALMAFVDLCHAVPMEEE